MTLGNNSGAATGRSTSGTNVDLNGYRLIDTGHIRLDVQPLVIGSRVVQRPDSLGYPLRTSAPALGGVFTASAGTPSVNTGTVSCNTPRCYPEPAAAFRKPDGVQRIWIAPYVSPDDAVHMGRSSLPSPSRQTGTAYSEVNPMFDFHDSSSTRLMSLKPWVAFSVKRTR